MGSTHLKPNMLFAMRPGAKIRFQCEDDPEEQGRQKFLTARYTGTYAKGHESGTGGVSSPGFDSFCSE